MESISALPESLVEVLSVTSAPLSSTAVRFLRAIPDPAENFNRALEILSMLEGEGGHPREPSGDGDVPSGFNLNAEFVLYWMYREFGVRKNPFLTHWIETCRRGLPAGGSLSKGKQKEGTVSPKNDGLVERARLRLLYHILAGEGEKISNYTPEEIYSNLDAFLPHKEVDMSYFELHTNSTFSDDDPFDQEGAGGENNEFHTSSSLQDSRELLSEAFERPLSSFERRRVEKVLERSPPLDVLSADLLSGLISNNPSIGNLFATAVLSSNGTDENGAGVAPPEAREYMLLTVLPRLDIDLPILEFITQIIEAKLLSAEEYRHLLHLYLAQAVRRTDLLDTSNFSGDSKHLGSINRRDLGTGAVPGRGKQTQARNIRLLCLFTENLLRKGYINVEEYFYEIQDIGVRYIWVKEARDLWMNVNGNNDNRGG